MYTLLLVDDEEEVIEAIVKKVKWEELGFQVILFIIAICPDKVKPFQHKTEMPCMFHASPASLLFHYRGEYMFYFF